MTAVSAELVDLPRLLSSIVEQVPARLAVLRLLDPASGRLVAEASIAAFGNPISEPADMLVGAGAAGRAVQGGDVTTADPGELYPGSDSLIAAPLAIGLRVLGTVELVDKLANHDAEFSAVQIGEFTAADRATLMDSARGAAAQINRAILYAETEEILLSYRRRNQEQSILGMVSRKILATESVDEILYIVLTAITSGHGMGYNRALAFLTGRAREELTGASGIGATRAEVERVWKEVPERIRRLEDHLDTRSLPPAPRSPFDARVRAIVIPMEDKDSILVRAVVSKRPFNVRATAGLTGVDKWFAESIESRAFAVVPVWGRTEVIGVIVIDNFITDKPILESDLDFLQTIANQCGLALDGAMMVDELSTAMKQLEITTSKLISAERLAAIGEIAASVAHEIRNPLTAIGGFSRRLARRLPEDEPGRRYAEIIDKEIARLELLASEVLDFAAAGKQERKKIDLLHLVRQWRDTNEILIASKKLKFKIESPVVMAVADQILIGQAITNILLNAVQAAPEGGEVSCFGGVRSGEVFLEIRDNGRGMTPDVRESAFKPFFTTKHAGTGLGLSLAQKAVIAHGGDIEIDSATDGGTTIRIVLPALE